MASGKPPQEWYSAWCKALYIIHSELDKHCDPALHRGDRAFIDYIYGGVTIDTLIQPYKYVEQLDTKEKIDGAIYVLTGAHLMGGEIMRRRLEGYPVKHLEWDDRKAALTILQEYRLRDDIGDEARDCFSALLAIMDEILERYPQ